MGEIKINPGAVAATQASLAAAGSQAGEAAETTKSAYNALASDGEGKTVAAGQAYAIKVDNLVQKIQEGVRMASQVAGRTSDDGIGIDNNTAANIT